MQTKSLQTKRALRTALLVLLLSVVGIGEGISQVTIGNLIYWLYDDGTASVYGHKNGASATGTLVIPEFVTYTEDGITNTYLVTDIGSYAFDNCSRLTGSLVIPNTVTSVGNGAFRGCSGFRGTLTLSNSLTYIGGGAFSGCSSFKGDLVIPNTVLYMDSYAFSGCSGFDGSLTLSNSLTSIPYAAFSGCSGFKGDLVIPNSVEYIEAYAFEGCSGFSGSLIIGNSVAFIGGDYGHVFSGCSGFKSVTIPRSLVSIMGHRNFYNCTGLTAVYYTGTIAQWCGIEFGTRMPYYFYANPLRYAHNLYINNHLVTDLVIPEGVVEIKQWAFCEATCLTSLKLPNSLKTVGLDAFYGCSNLSGNLILPNSLIIIDDNAFNRCSGLTGNLNIPNSVEEIRGNAFYGCSGFTGDLIIPNSVTYIGSGAFTSCSGFDGMLSLPNTITSIGHKAFEGCCNMKGDLIVPSSVKDIGYYAFKDCSSFTKTRFMPSNCTNHLEDYHPYYDWTDAPPFEGCSGALVVGENMHDVPAYLFKKAAFDEITLHNEVNSIGDEAFAGCDSLKTIRSWRNFPPALGDDVFANVDTNNVVVHVPCGQELDYRLADGWKDFNHYEMFISTWHLIVDSNDPVHCETEVVQLPLCLSGEAIVRARPANGYQFLGWYENDERVSRDTLYTFYHDSPRVLEARVRIGTGLEDIAAIEANVYPNPTNGKVRIEAEDLKQISISNMLGQVVYEGKAYGSEFTYDFSKHGGGLYLVRIETVNGVIVKKISVTK